MTYRDPLLYWRILWRKTYGITGAEWPRIAAAIFRSAEVKGTVMRIHRALKPQGLFLCTVPMLRRKGEYKASKQVEENTFTPLEGAERGVPHYLFTPEKVLELFAGFEIEMENGALPISEYSHYKLFAWKR